MAMLVGSSLRLQLAASSDVQNLASAGCVRTQLAVHAKCTFAVKLRDHASVGVASSVHGRAAWLGTACAAMQAQ